MRARVLEHHCYNWFDYEGLLRWLDGLGIFPDYQGCVPNALLALGKILLEGAWIQNNQWPRIYWVENPEIDLPHHAYLECNGGIYSREVTWLDDKYPNLTKEGIEALGGEDLTGMLVRDLRNVLCGLEPKFPFTSRVAKDLMVNRKYEDLEKVVRQLNLICQEYNWPARPGREEQLFKMLCWD